MALSTPFEIQQPVFPDRDFSIADFGAKGDGEMLNTKAIASAIAACHEAGGGRVIVPDGDWLTGPIHLKSRVNLHLTDRATLNFSDEIEHYHLAPRLTYVSRGGVEAMSFSPLIYAHRCTDIAITGKGTLNGNGKVWWEKVKPHERNGVLNALFNLAAHGVPVTERNFNRPDYGLRPAFIQPIDCTNVLLEGFTLRDGPAWNLNPVRCENLTIREIQLISPDGPNNDGIDPEMCRNVLIEDCFIDTADDCISLKSGRDEEGWRYGRPCENVIIRRVRTGRGLAGVAIGSEISGGVRNVLIEECHFEGTRGGIRIKTLPGRGGFIEDIVVRNITMKDIHWDAILVTVAYGRGLGSTGKVHTAVRRLHFNGIRCDEAATGITIIGSKENPIRDLSFERVSIKSSSGARFTHAADLRLSDVHLSESVAPTFSFIHVENAVIGGRVSGKTSPLFQVHGEIGRGLTIAQLSPTQYE